MLPDRSSPVPVSAEDWQELGQRLLASGAPIVAYDRLAEGLAAFPGDVRLRQLLALALARCGATGSAIAMLESLKAEGQVDEETLGLLARAHKDLAANAPTAADRQCHLEAAFSFYDRAHRLTGGTWTGINAATTALLLGRRETASTLAAAVRDRCVRMEADDPSRARDYWHLATVAEAWLLTRDWPAAEAAYARATTAASARPADLASTRRNARLIIRALGGNDATIERLLPVPRVVAFAGHLIDAPGRVVPRFPPGLETHAAAGIRKRLEELRAGFGYSSAACGADILFLETMRERGAETTIVLPYDVGQFARDSVDVVPGGTWPARYRECLISARDVFLASEQRIGGGEVSYEYAVLLVEGLAGVRADELDTEFVRLVLWDGKPGARGGTALTVERWRRAGHHVEVIDLEHLAREAGLPPTVAVSTENPQPAALAPTDSFEPDIVALLFADAKGFSRLGENQIPTFVDRFLGRVAHTLATSSTVPLLRNTWGDGLYFVFASVGDAGLFALDLAEALARTDWSQCGLPADLSLRIGLHAGPAYACLDPVTGRENYFGAHVSRAARIEPITPAGAVYASAAFAALARADGVQGFRCEYVGRTPLPKNAGTLPMFVVRRQVAALGA